MTLADTWLVTLSKHLGALSCGPSSDVGVLPIVASAFRVRGLSSLSGCNPNVPRMMDDAGFVHVIFVCLTAKVCGGRVAVPAANNGSCSCARLLHGHMVPDACKVAVIHPCINSGLSLLGRVAGWGWDEDWSGELRRHYCFQADKHTLSAFLAAMCAEALLRRYRSSATSRSASSTTSLEKRA